VVQEILYTALSDRQAFDALTDPRTGEVANE
jgi:hypothetical protein